MRLLPRSRAGLLLSLALVASGCASTLTGQPKLHLSAINGSGADQDVTVTFQPNETGQPIQVDLGTVPAGSFGERTVDLERGEYGVRASAGAIFAEGSWRMEPGEHGLELRISESTIELVRIE